MPVTVTFSGFVLKDGIPIYQQIIWYIKEGIVSGAVRSGDELPSRRVLSALLSVNPNTVQKAYKCLEDEGLIESHAGAKSYVSVSDEVIGALRQELYTIRITNIITSLKQMGLGREEALALISNSWEVETENE